MLKKIVYCIIVLLGLSLGNLTQAAESVELHFFYSPTCPHCADEKVLLDEWENKYPDLQIYRYNIVEPDTVDIIGDFYARYQVPAEEKGRTPVTFIQKPNSLGKYLLGYSQVAGQALEEYVVALMENGLHNGGQVTDISSTTQFTLPWIGQINPTGLSPLALSMIVGALDGFNACAMVALGFLLMILVSTGIRQRVFWIGGTFIFVSGLVYFLFITAWLNLFLFLGYLKVITIIVGVFIIAFSLFVLKDYFSGIVCQICQVKEHEGVLTKFQRKLFAKMTQLAQTDMPLIWLLLGVAVVAAGINLVELFCSLGFPLAYTKILTNYQLPTWQYYGYLVVYVIFYMLDDFLIFVLALFTLRVTKLSDRYLKIIKLISGIILLILGVLIIFRPEILA